jgi:lariat debranching enzyme
MPSDSPPAVFAAVGDVHGHMHAMVRLLSDWEQRTKHRLSFVLQVGDFEPVRDAEDLASTPGPAKYRSLGDFADFHQDRAEFPWPVFFIAGNHEPFAFLQTMPRGGQVAHNCHYLGRAGQTDFDGLRVSWMGGIATASGALTKHPTRDWKSHAYITDKDLDNVMVQGRTDILLLHEWPRGAATLAEAAGYRRSGGIDGPGSEDARALVDLLGPRLVLAGHSHWPHRSLLSERTQFIGLGHIDKERDAFVVFQYDEGGDLTEITD